MHIINNKSYLQKWATYTSAFIDLTSLHDSLRTIIRKQLREHKLGIQGTQIGDTRIHGDTGKPQPRVEYILLTY